MIWTGLSRLALLMNLAYTLKNFGQQHNHINPSRIYNSRETARLLSIGRAEVVHLLRSGELTGRLVNGNYRVTGKSIEGYLHNEI